MDSDLLTRILNNGHEVKFWMNHNGDICAEIIGKGYIAEGWGRTITEAVEQLHDEMLHNDE